MAMATDRLKFLTGVAPWLIMIFVAKGRTGHRVPAQSGTFYNSFDD
jgi:hypothetical protein